MTTTTPFADYRHRLQSALLAAYPELMARTAWTRARILDHQRARLRQLLLYGVEHSPFHARRLAGIDLDAVTPEDLSALPVMRKPEMMSRLDEVFTDRRLSRRLVEDTLADTAAEPIVILGEYLAFASGGASGARGVFVYDGRALVQHLGVLTRGLVAWIGQAGEPPPGGLPVAMVAAGSAVHQTGAAPAVTANGMLPFRFLSVPVTLPLHEVVARLDAINPAALFGYPTALARLAAERRAQRLRIAPAAVTCTSETCTPELRAAITSGFEAPLIDTFATSEGLAGSSVPGDDAITFSEDGCIVELVDTDGHPVPPGTSCAKVLVTNLYNAVQPLIRYELTDSFAQQSPAAGHGYLRARVRGRSDEVFRYGTIAIHPLVLRAVLVRVPSIVEYQIRQLHHGIEATVVGSGLDLAKLREVLAAALTDAGLAQPVVTVHTEAALSRDPQTGKIRSFVPLH